MAKCLKDLEMMRVKEKKAFSPFLQMFAKDLFIMIAVTRDCLLLSCLMFVLSPKERQVIEIINILVS